MTNKAYRRTEQGRVLVVDRRHLTNGAIVPNYVVDLYLPILGYEGLGVLTMLLRFVDRGKHEMKLDMHKHARVGRVGFRTLEKHLDRLAACQIITVTKPTGLARRFHHRTVVELLDPPTDVPDEWAEEVIQRTPTGWLFEQEVSTDTSMEMSTDTSMEMSVDTSIEVLPDTSIMDVPMEDVPKKDAPAADVGLVLPLAHWLIDHGMSERAAARHQHHDFTQASEDFQRSVYADNEQERQYQIGILVKRWDRQGPRALSEPAPTGDSWTRYANDPTYGGLFRLGSDVSDLLPEGDT